MKDVVVFMESLPVRRKSCLLKLRDKCPFRKLRRRTYDVSAATCSPIGSYWNNRGPLTSNKPISAVCSGPLPPLFRSQSEAVVDVHMEEDGPAAENQESLQIQSHQSPENRAGWMVSDLDQDVDPETGERAQG